VTIRRARHGGNVASVPTGAAPFRGVLVTDLVTAAMECARCSRGNPFSTRSASGRLCLPSCV